MFSHQTLILGIGSPGTSDGNAGILALKAFEQFHPGLPGVTCMTYDGSQPAPVDPLAAARHLIVFDCARFDARPGTIRCLVGREMEDYLRGENLGRNEKALARLLDTVRVYGRGPLRKALIGIQQDDEGGQNTSAVTGALPWAAALARELVERWSTERDVLADSPRQRPSEQDRSKPPTGRHRADQG